VTELAKFGFQVVSQGSDIGFDLMIERAGQRAAVIVKYSRRGIGSSGVARYIQTVREFPYPLLIVANQKLTTQAINELMPHTNVRFAEWNGEQDNGNLISALIDLGVYNS
jgi:hypothetical protein